VIRTYLIPAGARPAARYPSTTKRGQKKKGGGAKSEPKRTHNQNNIEKPRCGELAAQKNKQGLGQGGEEKGTKTNKTGKPKIARGSSDITSSASGEKKRTCTRNRWSQAVTRDGMATVPAECRGTRKDRTSGKRRTHSKKSRESGQRIANRKEGESGN